MLNIKKKGNGYPWYLDQSTKELLKKFQFIQNQEDERLREATNGTTDSRWSLGVSILEQNDYRNRYVNIMPYERNRVILNTVKGNEYINASYVKVDVPEQSINPGYYIATQGPTKYTWDQFWQMCYNECPYNDIVIVMVTPLVEHGREKCFPYWPNGQDNDILRIVSKVQSPSGSSSDISVFSHDLEVKFVNKEIHGNNYYTLTTIELTPRHPDIGPTKTVHHFYFDKWRDMSKPEEVLPIMALCRDSHKLNSPGNPMIVHCSAGVGRSGTFIALDHLIHDTLDFNSENDYPSINAKNSQNILAPQIDYRRDLIEQIVLQLRSQRMKMVQMKDQYQFIYHASKHVYDSQNKLK